MTQITNTTLLCMFNTTWLKERVLMDSWLDGSENLFFLSPYFHLPKNVEVEIAVFLHFLLYKLVQFHLLASQ